MKSQSVCIILENDRGEVLLMLRDDKPTIQYPNQWVLLGGVMEEGETPEVAVRREIKEEIEADLDAVELVHTYDWPEKVEYVYRARLSIDPERTPLNEGQMVRYFSINDAASLPLAFHDNEILRDFATR